MYIYTLSTNNLGEYYIERIDIRLKEALNKIKVIKMLLLRY